MSEKHNAVRRGPDGEVESCGSGGQSTQQTATPNQPQETTPAPGLGMDIIMSVAM